MTAAQHRRAINFSRAVFFGMIVCRIHITIYKATIIIISNYNNLKVKFRSLVGGQDKQQKLGSCPSAVKAANEKLSG